MTELNTEMDDKGDPEDGFLDVDLGDDCLPPQSPRIFIRSSAPYIADQGIERYQPALKSLIPVRREKIKKEEIGVDHAGLFSFIFSTWLSKLMYKAQKKGLVLEDIPRGSPFESCDHNVQRLELLWQEEIRNHGPSGASLPRAVWRFTRTRLITDCLVFLASLILGFLTPMIFMRKLLEFAENPQATIQEGLVWAFLLMFCELCRILCFSWRWVIAFRTAARLRVACLGLMYRKIVRLSGFEEKSMGQLINIFANDSQRISDMIIFGPMIIGGPLVLISGVLYVLIILSPWAVLGVLVFVAFYPVQFCISRFCGILRGKTVRVSDKRVSFMNEILTFAKTVKMNTWEEHFDKQIFDARAKEQSYIEKTSYIASVGASLAPTIPILSAIVTFLCHLGAGYTLTAAQRCLLVEEITPRIQRPIDRSQAVSIGGASFTWCPSWCPPTHNNSKKERQKKQGEHLRKSDLEVSMEEREKLNTNANNLNDVLPVLQCINFSASKGHLVGVCGAVGSGKTSLLLAILGQMRILKGQVARDGSCAYVSQQAWITNGTLRENILFGEAFVSSRYYAVVNSCALNEDLNQLPGGDLTEIGERGVNLSGGQRQRVALARALYANRDIYLLDDPLSAVDINVGIHLFENYIQKELQNNTVILVSHQMEYLKHCDEVYVMKQGCIIERGTHEELLALDKEYALMVKQSKILSSPKLSTELELSSTKGAENGLVTNKKDKSKQNDVQGLQKRDAGENLTVDEPSATGSLNIDTYCSYVSAAGGYMVASFVFFVFLINVGSTAFSSWWLATWIKAGGGNATVEVNNTTVSSSNLADNPDFEFYQIVYASTIALILFTCFFRCLIFTKATIRASSKLHNDLFHKVLHSPMLFFESNPIGRMQNLFARDMDEVDSRLPASVENIIGNFWILSFAVLFICIVFPWFFIALIPLGVIYYFVSRIFRKGIRDLKRLENSTRSPVFSKLAESAQGVNTIRAFNKEGDYIQRFFQLCDDNATCNYLWNVGMRWLAVRIDLLAAVTMSITAFLVVILHGVVAPAMAGLALSYSWHISGVLQLTTRLISETEVRFISVERILAYMEAAVTEGKPTSSKPNPSWPDHGHIWFDNVCMSYRKNLPNVLSQISFNILSSEKIGIVGRTGSGKSSLAVALFRLVELNSGRIKVDGIDIADVPLSVLRSKISIIPQDPVLFSGTIRCNLDYKNKCSDSELWDALRKTRMSESITALPQKLDTVISNGSVGLSVGQCQLLCLTRALLMNSKIIFLDEATASIDPETEAAVQSTIEEEFKTCTIVIIAHRLTTVAKCDRILVMEEGKLLEFEEPSVLLNNPNSAFTKIISLVVTQ